MKTFDKKDSYIAKQEKRKMKTFDKKDVYSWSNAEEAKEYLGKDCYFAHSVGGLSEHIKTGVMGILKDIFNSNYDAVSEVEEPKKWRPFENFSEFRCWTGKGVGSVIVYRDKLTNDELEAVIIRSKLYENFVEIGAVEYTFKELFNQWEWLSNRNEWQPFGIKVEEQDSERSKDKDVDTSLSDYMDKRIKEISKE